MSLSKEMAIPKGKVIPPNKRRLLESDPNKKIDYVFDSFSKYSTDKKITKD